MVLTSRWLTLADASCRLNIPEFEVLELAVSGRLHSRLQYDHREVCAADVDEFASELATRMGDVLAEHVDIPVRQGRLDHEGEDDYFKERQT